MMVDRNADMAIGLLKVAVVLEQVAARMGGANVVAVAQSIAVEGAPWDWDTRVVEVARAMSIEGSDSAEMLAPDVEDDGLVVACD